MKIKSLAGILSIIVPGLVLVTAHDSLALPQLAARLGSTMVQEHRHAQSDSLITFDCRACHVNPTGGGMRNAHGRQFSIEQLPMTGDLARMQKAVDAAQLTDFLSIGTDIRFAYLLSNEEGGSNEQSFFPMQADLYLAFTPFEHVTLYYQDGVEERGNNASRETFVLFESPRYNSHLKLGRFIPPYGLKLADHTSFIREALGFGAPSFGQDGGLEIGFGSHHAFANFAVVNGSGSFRDTNREKAVSATGGLKTSNVWLAGSYFNNETNGNKRTYAGAYGMGHWRRLTVLGEWDWIRVEAATKTIGWVAYGELNVELVRGVFARIKYDGLEPDRDVDNDDIQRLTYGLDLYPYPFTEVLIQYRNNIEKAGLSNDDFLIMLHMFY